MVVVCCVLCVCFFAVCVACFVSCGVCRLLFPCVLCVVCWLVRVGVLGVLLVIV